MLNSFENFKQKITRFYKSEDGSKSVITVIFILTAVVAFVTVNDKGLRAAILSQNENQQTTQSAEPQSVFRQCIWDQNTLFACKPGGFEFLGIELGGNPSLDLGNSIEIRPSDPDNPNADNTSWSGTLIGLAEVQELSGSGTLGSTHIGGEDPRFDYTQAGGFLNRLNAYNDQIDLGNQFPQPILFGGKTTVEGTDFTQDSKLTVLADGLGDNFVIYALNPIDYTSNYTDVTNRFTGVAEEFKKGTNPTIDPSIDAQNLGNSTSTIEDQIQGLLEWAQDLYNAISDPVGSIEDFFQNNFAGTCVDVGSEFAVSSILERTDDDVLPSKTYLTNAGEVYSYPTRDSVCEEYLNTPADDEIFNAGREGSSNFENEDFFDIACKPECVECELKERYFECNETTGSTPPGFPFDIVRCSNSSSQLSNGDTVNLPYGKPCPGNAEEQDGSRPSHCKVRESGGFDYFTETAKDELGYICENNGRGRDAEDIQELNKNGFDSDYADQICRVNTTTVSVDGQEYEPGELFEREESGTGPVNNPNEIGSGVACKLNEDTDKPIPDKELLYYYENSTWQPEVTQRQAESGGVRPWCQLNWDENTRLFQTGNVNFELTQAELPGAGFALINTMQRLESVLPFEGHLCVDENIAVAMKSKVGVLDTSKCEYFKLIEGTKVSYVSTEELLAREDLPFNEGGNAQMCAPDIRIEPACEFSTSNPPSSSAQLGDGVSIDDVPTIGGAQSVYTVFPYLGNAIVDFDQKFSKVVFNVNTLESEGQSSKEYVNRILNESGIRAHVCETTATEMEYDLISRYLFETGVITQEELDEINKITARTKQLERDSQQ